MEPYCPKHLVPMVVDTDDVSDPDTGHLLMVQTLVCLACEEAHSLNEFREG